MAARTRIKDIRRRDLQAAAYEVLQEHGFGGATVARVAARAGMSPGIVHHYFKNKDELLEAAIRYANAGIREAVIHRLGHASSPAERVEAIILGNFEPTLFTKGHANAWVSFCAQVPHSPRYERIQKAFHRRLRSNLTHALKGALPEPDISRICGEISTLIDGLWLRRSIVGGEEFTRDEALRQLYAYMEANIPVSRKPAAATV